MDEFNLIPHLNDIVQLEWCVVTPFEEQSASECVAIRSTPSFRDCNSCLVVAAVEACVRLPGVTEIVQLG